ncbi:unnamed protein product [Mortierella alpina]
MILESPPLVNVTPLAAIHEVPIHIRHPIYPNSTSKRKRLGLLMLNELTRVEMLVARIEAAGKHEETSAELKRSIAHLEQTLSAYELEKKPAGVENSSGRMLLQRYMIRTGLDEMFSKSSEFLGIEPVIPGGNFIEGVCAPAACALRWTTTTLQAKEMLTMLLSVLPTHSSFSPHVEHQPARVNRASSSE